MEPGSCYREPLVPLLSCRFAALTLSAITLVILTASVARSQPITGTITGTVKASTDAVLAGATVKVRNETVGLERTVITDEEGFYTASNLPVQGVYEVQVEFSGFAPMVQSGVSLIADARVVIDLVMHAASAETLVVTGRVTTTREPERSTVQQIVSETLVQALPLAGRDFITLAQLTPGFTGNPNYPNALGQIYWANNVTVDGASHYSKSRGAARTFYSGYPLGAIKEVQVLTSQYSAEYGESLASITSAVTNSGTNTVHGSMLIFGQQTIFNDIPAFTPLRSPFGLQRFGVTLGGPLVKDRTHYFVSYEGRRQRGHAVVVSPAAEGALTTNNEDEHLLFAKGDHKTSAKDLMSARYNGQRFRWRDEPGGLSLPGVGTRVKDDVHTVLVSSTRLISDVALNQIRVQFARYTSLRTDLQPNVYIARIGYSIQGGLNGPVGLGVTPEETFEASDTLSHRLLSHALKMGGGVRRVSAHNESLPFGNGAYFFGGPPDQFPTPFLYTQGLVSSREQAVASPRGLSMYLFAQDSWQVRPALTIDAGLRYDVERVTNVEGFDVSADKNNLQPRLGVAWELFPGTTVIRGGGGTYSQQQLLLHINKVQLEGPSGVAMVNLTPDSSLFPTYPQTLPASVLTQLPRDVQRVAPEFRNPYSLQATAGIEHRLNHGIVLSVDGIYLRGRDLISLIDSNAPASLAKPLTRTVAQADATRPLTPVAGGVRKIIELGNEGESWYRALQVKANKTTGRLQAALAYTYAHADDLANYQLPEDSRNLPAERARADADIRHNLSLGFTWRMSATHPLLNGLVLSGVERFRSGHPYTVIWGDDRNGTTQGDARPGGRNTFTTTAFRNVDLSVARQFRVGPRAIEGRIEAFNVLSTVNNDLFEGNLNSSFYGRPVTAFPRRRIQFGAIVRF